MNSDTKYNKLETVTGVGDFIMTFTERTEIHFDAECDQLEQRAQWLLERKSQGKHLVVVVKKSHFFSLKIGGDQALLSTTFKNISGFLLYPHKVF